MLETIRATTDKNGRPVAPLFETLPSRAGNPEYYKQVRLPLSLELMERKLKNHQYPTLSALESDFKRLVQNAKETNSRNSEAFNDAERIRKAVSNLMVKQNPAYKAGNYTAVPTPLPPSPGADDAPGEEDESIVAQTGANDDEDEDEAEEAEDDEEEDDEDEDEDEEPEPQTVTRKRRVGRPPKSAATPTPKASRSSSTQVDNFVGFKGLTFQQAQEKIVNDILQKKDDSDEYLQFEAFHYLPPRSLKDYFEIIAEPISLKALQKQIRGQHGRNEPTGISDFKTWSQFEDQASLLWKNAYHYNEDGSEIYLLAQDLEVYFKELLQEAKQLVPEPPQPKIKLKIPQNAETPTQPKKITIHVAGGGKNSAADSPVPATAHSTDGTDTRHSTPIGRTPFGGAATGNSIQLDRTRSIPTTGQSRSPSVSGAVKHEDAARQSPAIPPPGPAMITQQQFAPVGPGLNGTPQPPPPPPPPKLTAADILEAQKYRAHPIKASDALLSRVVISSHPSLNMDKPLDITIQASTTETQQELVFNAPATYYRLQLRPQIAPFLEAQQREWKLNVTHDYNRLYPSSGPDRRNDPIFDVNLRYGTNRLEVGLVAALPKGEKGPHGLDMEMEKIVVHFNLLKHH
ncbi:Bromodomain-containing protein [Xylariales sp. PMI_506]|nr:Bromodomain-containing protein [Xylariales sp. PMI_506]